MSTREERCIGREESRYPQALRRIKCAPAKLYVRGRLPDERLPSVAVIGARRCSSYGREMAQWFAGELAAAGVQIISGMALGVDGIAQRAALAAGGQSFGVLGCGTDVCYPAANRDLYDMLLEKGGVLSEHPRGTPPLATHFPSRNRIISALADLVLVIEARERSGTLITVDFALEQGKDVYALPGRTTDALSCGCNCLIRQGAGIAMRPSDITEALSGKSRSCEAAPQAEVPGGQAAESEGRRAALAAGGIRLGERERIVWDHMEERPLTLQRLYEKIKSSQAGKDMKLQEVTDILVSFAVRGIVLRECGNQYERKGRIPVLSGEK